MSSPKGISKARLEGPLWALGQFYFHVIAAYAIIRKEGVEIGKADYVPHMFAYLRPATAEA